MKRQLDALTIKGFKSIQSLEDFKLTNLNIIVGENGAGKSNFISFFKLLQSLNDNRLQSFVRNNGGARGLLFKGQKKTKAMEFKAQFGKQHIQFQLVPTPENSCVLDSEDQTEHEVREPSPHPYGNPSLQIYHFHDTSPTSGMRHYEIVQDHKKLRPNGDNIAPFLLMLQNEYPRVYQSILHAVRVVIPFFDTFLLEPRISGPREEVNVSWIQKESDYPMQPYQLSDGSLRFICLATALLQPNPPTTIVIDEPELGLHPGAIEVLAELIECAAQKTQIIIATQSPLVIDYFSIEDLVVVRQKNGASFFTRLKESDFQGWLEDYSIGELWRKNVIQGAPLYE